MPEERLRDSIYNFFTRPSNKFASCGLRDESTRGEGIFPITLETTIAKDT
jgi:hypothetical protein